MKLILASLMLVAFAFAGTYEIKSQHCTVLYDSFSHKFKTKGDCLIRNISGNDQLVMDCFYANSDDDRVRVIYVNEDDYFFEPVADGKIIGSGYDFVDFSKDISSGAFRKCQLTRIMTIKEIK